MLFATCSCFILTEICTSPLDTLYSRSTPANHRKRLFMIKKQRWYIIRSAKWYRLCILDVMYSAYLRLESLGKWTWNFSLWSTGPLCKCTPLYTMTNSEAIFTNSSRTLFAKCSQTYRYLGWGWGRWEARIPPAAPTPLTLSPQS